MEFPYERAALILAEAQFFGDIPTANRWGVTDRTIRNYRARAASDPQLSALFQLKSQLLHATWVDDVSRAVKVAATSLQQLCTIAEKPDKDGRVQVKGNREDIYVVTGALKVLGELKVSQEALSEPEYHCENSAT